MSARSLNPGIRRLVAILAKQVVDEYYAEQQFVGPRQPADLVQPSTTDSAQEWITRHPDGSIR